MTASFANDQTAAGRCYDIVVVVPERAATPVVERLVDQRAETTLRAHLRP